MGKGYGQLPPREANFQPWFEVAVDTIRPWKINICGQNVEVYAVTIIDFVTNLTELVQIVTPSALQAAQAMELGWLMQYPCPMRVVHDQGPEYQGSDFQALLTRWGIKNIPTSVQNPQANGCHL